MLGNPLADQMLEHIVQSTEIGSSFPWPDVMVLQVWQIPL